MEKVKEVANQTENPLVSIIVVTYNSVNYVLETLESAKAQIYQNIELIITDDCSTDNTIEICQKWLEENKTRFVRSELVKAETNKGIVPNCNQGLYKAEGEWVKFIAGDDILLDNCIKYNINAVLNNSYKFFFTQLDFTDTNVNLQKIFQNGFNLLRSEKSQFKILLKQNCLPAPSAFINRNTLLKLNGFDERFPMLEDYPCWIKATKNKVRIGCSNVKTVIYRIHQDGLSQKRNNNNNNNKTIFYNNIKFTNSWYDFLQKILLPEQFKNYLFLNFIKGTLNLIQYKIVKKIFKNKRNAFSNIVFTFFEILKPSFYKLHKEKK